MDDLFLVEILQPASHLLQEIPSQSLVTSSPGLFLDELRQIPSRGKVQDHEDPGGILERSETPQDVFVIDECLNLDFSLEMKTIRIVHASLQDKLYGNHAFGDGVPALVHLSE